MTSQSQIDNIRAYFPYANEDMPKISTADAPPNYTTILAFQDAANDQAMAVPAPNTDLGHSYLTMKKEHFNTANTTTYTPPKDPGTKPSKPISSTRAVTRLITGGTVPDTTATPVVTPTDPFEAQETIRQFVQDQHVYQTWRATHTLLKNMIISNCADEYISELKDPRTKYATVTFNDFMKHLWTNYGAVDIADLTANEERMKAQWIPPTPIETLFKQLKEGKEFAEEGGETISDGQLVRYGYDILTATGVFTKDCNKWRKKKAADQTWKKFQTYFTAAAKDYAKNLTSADTYTPTAAQVQQLVDSRMSDYTFEHHQPPAQQPTPDQTPPQQACAVTMDGMEAMFAKYMETKKKTDRSSNRNRKSPTASDSTNKKHLVCQGVDEDGCPITYCHSHGITRNLRHNSTTCQRPGPNHKKEATLDNKLGGCTTKQKSK